MQAGSSFRALLTCLLTGEATSQSAGQGFKSDWRSSGFDWGLSQAS